jgi:hypothetical protein
MREASVGVAGDSEDTSQWSALGFIESEHSLESDRHVGGPVLHKLLLGGLVHVRLGPAVVSGEHNSVKEDCEEDIGEGGGGYWSVWAWMTKESDSMKGIL